MSDGLGRIEPAVFVVAALLWLGGTGSAAGAQDLSTTTASAPSTHSVYLEYRELDSANGFYRERLKNLLCVRPVAPPVPEERSAAVARG
jgi:hypothetical protein